jgi:O-acetylhomoserine/O-acetylserine sulfhydrylase-like pyridoxal-dependent enzyme
MNRLSKSDLEKLSHRYKVLFAVFCAEQVIYLVNPKDKDRCLKAIDAAKRWVRGEVDREECRDIAHKVSINYMADYNAAAAYAANAAACAASVVVYSNWATGWAYDASTEAINAFTSKHSDAAMQRQWDYYYELLNLDSNLESLFTTNR